MFIEAYKVSELLRQDCLKTAQIRIGLAGLSNTIENVNFLHDDIVDVLQNTIDWCIHSATYRLG